MPRPKKAKARKMVDADVRTVSRSLKHAYGAAHPRAVIDVFKRNSATIWVRIIDPDFKGMTRYARERVVWPIVESWPEELQEQLVILLLITPEERKRSVMSAEFDDPSPTVLEQL
jgi:stress-induced morphogen